MPWDCSECGASVLDDQTQCSAEGCTGTKHDWTVGGNTRQIVISGSLLEVLRGARTEPLPLAEERWSGEALSLTEVAPALRKRDVARVHADGLRPGPNHVVVVRGRQSSADKELELAIEFSRDDVREERYPLRATGYFEARFLFVFGEDPAGWASVGFPGLEVVDLSEEGDPGYATELEFSAFRKVRELSVEEVESIEPRVVRVGASATRYLNEMPLPFPIEGAGHPVAALVRAAGYLTDQGPKHKLVLVGHASAPGSDSTNDKVSQARVDALLALIESDEETWVSVATQHASLRDIKVYLAYLARERGWGCDPGELTTSNDSAAKAGVEAFQREFNEGLGAEAAEKLDEDGKCGSKTLGAIFDVLEHELLRWLEKHGLTRDALRMADPPTIACGETYAQSELLYGEASEASRRSVELLLLPPEIPVDHAAIYSGEYEFVDLELEDEPGAWEQGSFLLFTDVDTESEAPNERFTLEASDGSYARTLSTSTDGVREFGGVDLHFEGVPTQARFKLVAAPEVGEAHTLFEDVPYNRLGGQSDYALLHGDGEWDFPGEVL